MAALVMADGRIIYRTHAELGGTGLLDGERETRPEIAGQLLGYSREGIANNEDIAN